MPLYDIESKDFALSAHGIHLLRNRFNYQTIGYNDVYKASLTKAVETKNVALTLIAGFAFLAFAVYNAIGVYESFTDPSVHRIYIESILILVFPLLLGFYCIYISVKKVSSLVIEVKDKKHKLSIQDISKAGLTDVLRTYLNDKLGPRFYDIPGL